MRNTKLNSITLVLALAITFIGARAAAPQQPESKAQGEQSAKKEAPSDVNVYRVSYKVDEVENGKTINSRSYTLMAKTDRLANTRIGSRIPFNNGQGIQYLDVGMDIDCTVREQEGSLLVYTLLNLSTIEDKQYAASSQSPPVLRHLSLRDDTVSMIGKPAFVGSIDDVASNRRFVIEVTVTQAK